MTKKVTRTVRKTKRVHDTTIQELIRDAVRRGVKLLICDFHVAVSGIRGHQTLVLTLTPEATKQVKDALKIPLNPEDTKNKNGVTLVIEECHD